MVLSAAALNAILKKKQFSFKNLFFFVLCQADKLQNFSKYFEHETIANFDRRQTIVIYRDLTANVKNVVEEYLVGDYITVVVGSAGFVNDKIEKCDKCGQDMMFVCIPCAPAFVFQRFRGARRDQSNKLYNLFLRLKNDFEKLEHPCDDVLLGPTPQTGLLLICPHYISANQKTRIARGKEYAKLSHASLFCTVSSASISIKRALNTGKINKILVGVHNILHCTALLVEKDVVDGCFVFTCYNANNRDHMTMVDALCHEIVGKTSRSVPEVSRTIRYITRPGSNLTGDCFPYTWSVIYDAFNGDFNFANEPTDFVRDFINKKNV